MLRFRFSLLLVFCSCFLALSQQGCAIKEVVVTQAPTGSAPNALQIGQEIETQRNQIDQASKTGDLEPPMALGLSQNDELVKQLSLKFRAANPSPDLTTDQAGFLEALLNGNSAAINDALQRRDVWVQAFEGNGNYNYAVEGDRLLFISVLQGSLWDQESIARGAAQAGNLSPAQTQEAQSRLQSVRDAEIGYFKQNGGLDLTSDQILELQQMADDSGRFIRFLAQGTGGGGAYAQNNAGTGDGSFTGQALSSVPPSNYGAYSAPAASAGSNTNYWNGRPTNLKPKTTLPNPAPVFTPVPSPTFTPVPSAPTFTPVPPPTFTPTPLAATPTAVPLHMGRPELITSDNTNPGVNASSISPQQTSEAYLAPDSLKARDKQLDKLFDSSRKQGKGTVAQAAAAIQTRKAFHQALKNFLLQNQQKGVTQDEMDQLSRMLDGYANAIADFTPPTPVPGKEK